MRERIISISQEPVSLIEARKQCYIDADDSDGHPQDTMLELYIKAARSDAETFTGLSFAIKTIELALDSFPEDDKDGYTPSIQLTAPVTNIISVKYYDADDELQTLSPSSYAFDSYSKPGWLSMVDGYSWPKTYSKQNAVLITYETGYGSSDFEEVPPQAKIAILLGIGHLFENRQDVVDKPYYSLPLGAENYLRPLRVKLGMA